MLNTEKTELLAVGSSSRISQVRCDKIEIMNSEIAVNKSVKYLGVKLDQTLSMSDRVSDICRSSFLSLRRIGCIRKYLTEKATSCLVNSLVTSRLDFCNSALYGISNEQFDRLQRIQNHAARLISKKKKHEHVTPTLCKLHWLPVKYRVQFKIAVFAFRYFEATLPSYLSSSLCTYQPSRSLRSSSEKLLVIPRVNLKAAGEPSFTFAAPTVWNSLPNSLRNSPNLLHFKRELKTYLFRQAFPDS